MRESDENFVATLSAKGAVYSVCTKDPTYAKTERVTWLVKECKGFKEEDICNVTPSWVQDRLRRMIEQSAKATSAATLLGIFKYKRSEALCSLPRDIVGCIGKMVVGKRTGLENISTELSASRSLR